MVVTTSAASKGLPSLNVMPWRSLNVQTSRVSWASSSRRASALERHVVVQVDEVLAELGDKHDAALVVDGDRVDAPTDGGLMTLSVPPITGSAIAVALGDAAVPRSSPPHADSSGPATVGERPNTDARTSI